MNGSVLEKGDHFINDFLAGGIIMSEKRMTNSLTTRTVGNVLIMERIFNAPRELVFQAFSESTYLENWWGPKGWKTENHRFEFKPNGVWRYCMKCTDKNQGEFYGQVSCGKAIFQEIIVPERIVYTETFVDEKGKVIEGTPETLVTMIFTEHEGDTKLVVKSQFASVDILHQIKNMGVVQGFSSQFERLDDILKQQ